MKTKQFRSEAKWSDSRISINNILSSPSKFSHVNSKKVISSTSKWSPPLGGSVKFNTDNVVVGSFETVGIGGISRGVDLVFFDPS
ncbi:hypothetical protein GQ457_03G028500 [Hibiscus cannabinus]